MEGLRTEMPLRRCRVRKNGGRFSRVADGSDYSYSPRSPMPMLLDFERLPPIAPTRGESTHW